MKLRISYILFLFALCLIWSGPHVFAQTTFKNVTAEKGFIASLTGDTHGSGVAAGDFDNDGDLDLYVSAARGYSDLVYENRNGTFVEVSASLGLGSLERSRMALWIDYNGDSKLDLLVAGDCDYDQTDCANKQNIRLYRQESNGFVETTEEAGLLGFGPSKKDQTMGGLAAADLNVDGYIDFIQVTRNGRLLVFINNREGAFMESSQALGFAPIDFKYYQPFIVDIDNDGDLDIYCNVDFDNNQLWLNDGSGHFTQNARSVGAANSFNEMGIAVGDFDNDEDFDIYSTNILKFLAKNVHNILLRNNLNQGRLSFTEVSKSLGVHEGGWGWGTTFLDADNDGWLDLAETNGWDLPFEVIDQSKFWFNKQGQTFVDSSAYVGFNDLDNAASLITLDYDRDGDLDMIQTLKGKKAPEIPIRLLENQLERNESQNFITIIPRMEGHNHFALGTVVKTKTNDITQSRVINAGTSFFGQEPAEAFFGLGNATLVDELSIYWPGGAISNWFNITANQTLLLTDADVVHSPTNFNATLVGKTVVLDWVDYASNETNYVIQKSIDADFSSYSEFQLAENTTHYTDVSINANYTYYYRIKAMKEDLSSISSPIREVVSYSSELGANKLMVFPNPVSIDNPNLHLIGVTDPSSIGLFDNKGNQIAIESITSNPDQTAQITFQSIQPGIYILKHNGKGSKIWVK